MSAPADPPASSPPPDRPEFVFQPILIYGPDAGSIRPYEDNMPKLKSKSGAKKRFKVTATGKVVAGHALKRHGLRKRSQKMKRSARGTKVLQYGDARLIKDFFLPYA
jgi:large subunit ribosomal protein L35